MPIMGSAMFEHLTRALFRQEQKAALATPSPELMHLFGVMAAASGTAVTPEAAMRCAPWAAAVRIISESLAQLPLHLYQRTANGGKERATDHPLETIFTGQANPWTSAYEFRRDMQAALAAHGKAGAVIVRAGDTIKELHQIPSGSFAVEIDTVTLEPRFAVSMADGTRRIYSYTDFFYLGALGISPGCPLTPWAQAREAIGLSMVMELHGAKLFANGAKPSGVLTHPGKLGAEARKRLRESFDSVHQGGENSGKTLVLDEGLKWESLTFNSVDMQFLELRKFQVLEISRFTRIPPHMLGELGDATFSNVEQMGGEFLALTLMPHLKLWEGAIARSLLQLEYRRPMNTETPGGDNRPGKQPAPTVPSKPRIVA
jgi:HK97 family phage portal protein